jgi:hypothetical protein
VIGRKLSAGPTVYFTQFKIGGLCNAGGVCGCLMKAMYAIIVSLSNLTVHFSHEGEL